MSKLALGLSLCSDMLGSAARTNHRTKDSQRVIPITVRIKDTHRRRNQQMSQPPVDRESLQVLLARIHERLNEAGSVDAGSREMLGQVMGDIERALAQGSPRASCRLPRALGNRRLAPRAPPKPTLPAWKPWRSGSKPIIPHLRRRYAASSTCWANGSAPRVEVGALTKGPTQSHRVGPSSSASVPQSSIRKLRSCSLRLG